MKRVSYKVAKALKEAGYPQGNTQGQYAKMSYYDNELEHHIDEGTYTENFIIHGIDAPTYLEAWLWLWREKNIRIDIITDVDKNVLALYGEDITDKVVDSNPEDAIEKAIEYLIEHNLIK